jgi:hypothetical protein
MALNRITLKNAQEIVENYMVLMENKSEKDYSYSEMHGYDIYDIDNSLKLLTAYYVYDSYMIDDERLKKLEVFAAWGDDGVNLYFMSFVPDHIYKEISKHKCLSLEYLDRKIELLFGGDVVSKDHREFLERKLETTKSFLDFCIKTGKNNPEYWSIIYSRLNLKYIPKDEIIDTTKNAFL